MNFKYWLLLLNENVEENWDLWCDNLEKYAQNNPSEKRILNSLKDILDSVYGNPRGVPPMYLDLKLLIGLTHARASGRIKARAIINVLKEKNVENYNWFAFSMGFIVSYNNNFHEEDLRAAIDETKRRISSGELLKSEIGSKGWLVIGSESKTYVDAAIERSQQISKREQERLRKSGETLSEDPRLIKVVAKEGDYTLYLCPRLSFYKEDDKEKEKLIGERHMILCKYGKGGKFCTADPKGTYHRNYATNDIYIFHVKDKVKYQFVSCKDRTGLQFHDVRNLPPEEVLGSEYEFLIANNAPIDCYNLPVVNSLNQKDLIDKIKSGNLSRITLRTIESGLMKEIESTKDLNNIELLLNAAVEIWSKNSANSRIRLSDIIGYMIENTEDNFVQQVIKKVLETTEKRPFNHHMLDAETWKYIFQASNLENLENLFSKELISLKVYGILTKPDVLKVLEKFNYSSDVVKILSKYGHAGSSKVFPIIETILNSKDKQRIINVFRTYQMLDDINDSDLADLLMCRLPSTVKEIYNKPKSCVSGKEMASMLGSEIVSKLTLKQGVLDSPMLKEKGDTLRWHGIELTTEQIKNFLEGIAAKHNNMDGEDVFNIIIKYKKLNIHKAEEKITKILGKKKMSMLSRDQRERLKVLW